AEKYRLPQYQPPGIAQQLCEPRGGVIAAGALQPAAGHFEDIVEGPATDDRVIRQDQYAHHRTDPADTAPHRRHTGLAGEAAHRVDGAHTPFAAEHHFGHHHRHPHQQDATQVNEHEGAAAVFTGDVWKLPDIAKADSRAGRRKDEGPTARPGSMAVPVFITHDPIP